MRLKHTTQRNKMDTDSATDSDQEFNDILEETIEDLAGVIAILVVQ